MYDRLGRASLKFAFLYLRRRYRREARVALGLGLLAALILAYLASREVPEG